MHISEFCLHQCIRDIPYIFFHSVFNPVFKSCKPPGQFNSGEWCGAFTLFSTHRRWSRLPRCHTNQVGTANKNLAHNTHRQFCGPTRLATNGEYFRILDVNLRLNHLYIFYEMFSAFLWWWNTIVWLILIMQITHVFLLDYAVQPLQWRHNERDGASNNRRPACLLNHVFRRRSYKHQSSAPLAFARPYKRPVTRKMFPFDDVIATNSCAGNPNIDKYILNQIWPELSDRHSMMGQQRSQSCHSLWRTIHRLYILCQLFRKSYSSGLET